MSSLLVGIVRFDIMSNALPQLDTRRPWVFGSYAGSCERQAGKKERQYIVRKA